MGKITAAVIICIVSFQNVFGQIERDPSADFRLGYGFLSDVQMIAAFADTYSTISSGISGDPEHSEYTSAGPVIARYVFFVSRKLSIGPEINLVQVKITERYSTGESIRDRFFFVNISGRVDYHYTNRENLGMYSGIALGPSYIFDQSDNPSEDRSGFFIAYQLNFFGIRFGKEWGGYAEFGFGRNGLLNVGISKQF